LCRARKVTEERIKLISIPVEPVKPELLGKVEFGLNFLGKAPGINILGATLKNANRLGVFK